VRNATAPDHEAENDKPSEKRDVSMAKTRPVDRAPARLLRSLGKPGVEAPRQVKAGSVIMREYQGVVHEVIVVPGGFCWQGRKFDSLSTIAKKIAGTNWNGPRFFGLRSKETPKQPDAVESSEAQKAVARAGGRRSSVRAGSAAERAP
jgi:hypothetical protein